MNLYQIDSALAECVDAETGEILDVEKLLELNMAREQKIENIASFGLKTTFPKQRRSAKKRRPLRRADRL